MSRSGYHDDLDEWALIMWRGAVKSAIRGKRGQAFLREMIAALDAMPEKRLIVSELVTKDGSVCAMGAVCKARGLDVSEIDPYDYTQVANALGLSEAMVREIAYENDDGMSDVERWRWMRDWASKQLRAPGAAAREEEKG